jgi:hypothetical protein
MSPLLRCLALAALALLGCQPGLQSQSSGSGSGLFGSSDGLGLGRSQDLAAATAGHTGCEPSEIYIYNRDQSAFGGTTSWGADCQGRSYRCSSTAGNSSCTERGGAAKPAQVAAPATAAAPPAGGVRRTKGASGHYLISLKTTDKPFQLTFIGSPAQDSEKLLLTIKYPPELISGECPPSVMVDGAIQPALGHRFKRTLKDSEIQVELPVSLLRTFVKPHRVVGRVCGEEWRLGPEDQQQVAELLVRWDEEVTWAGKK